MAGIWCCYSLALVYVFTVFTAYEALPVNEGDSRVVECHYLNKTFPIGHLFNNGPCQQCVCNVNGDVKCVQEVGVEKCPAVFCTNGAQPVLEYRECCPTCPVLDDKEESNEETVLTEG